jgi:prolyl-tRNA synthetase
MKAQFPLLIPRSFLEIEKDHVKGFASEVFWVTRGGNHPFEDGQEYALRPTSETAMYHMYVCVCVCVCVCGVRMYVCDVRMYV